MIASHVLGGIGNQMFQYAAGRSLAAHLKQEFFLDQSSFDCYSLHNGFELDRVFNISTKELDVPTLIDMLGWRLSKLAIKFLKRPQFSFLRGKNLVVEPHMHYWPLFFEANSNSYLYGYWQSEKYFKRIEATIRQDFIFKKPLVEKNLDNALHIASVNSVSLHVRRGDYVSNYKTSQIMDVCSLDYYRQAIDYIAKHIKNPVFYIFSDDIAWVQQNLSLYFPCTYIDHNRGNESYIDMQLMSLCKHHIIANSSFSWWGAWLNPRAAKIVIAPRVWFRNGNNDSDLIPSEWVRL